jgi:hypothetical protein
MRPGHAALNLAVAVSLAACAGATCHPGCHCLPGCHSAAAATPAAVVTPTHAFNFAAPEPAADPAYTSLNVPLIQRAAGPQAGLDTTRPGAFMLHTGEFQLELSASAPASASRPGTAALSLQPLGPALRRPRSGGWRHAAPDSERPGVVVAGHNAWMSYAMWLWVYPHNPGLLRYHLELTRSGDVPAGGVEPEWAYVDPATGEDTAANYTAYADRSSFAAPSFYGYSAA